MSRPSLQTLCLAGSVLALVGSFALFMAHALPTLTFGYSLNYGEGVLLDQVRRIEAGEGLYPSFEEPPYVIDNYPPVYPYLARWIPTPPDAPFFGGRFLSILATLVSSGMIILLVRRRSGDAAGLLAGSVFLLLPEVQRFGVIMRVDLVGLAFGLVGLHAFTAPGRAQRWVGGIAFFLSVYTRHSMLALPLAGSIILWRHEGRRAVPAISALVSSGIAAFLIGDFALGGRLHEHLINFNVVSFDPSTIESKWLLTQWPGGLLLVFAAFLSLRPSERERRSLPWTGVVHWILVALALLFVGHFASDCVRQDLPGSPPVWARLRSGAQKAHSRNQDEAEIRAKMSLLADAERGRGDPENPRVIRDLETRIRRLEARIEPYPSFFDLSAAYLLLGLAGSTAFFTGVWRRRRVSRSDRDSATEHAGLLIGLGLLSAVLIGRSGSDVNYLLECLTLLIVAAGWGLAKASPERPAIPTLIIVFLCVFGIGVGGFAFFHRDTRSGILEEKAQAAEKILATLREIPGPILSEHPAFPAILGRPLVYQPFMYRELYDSGHWDPGPLVAEIRRKAFVVVVREAVVPYAGFENAEAYFASSVSLRSRAFPPPVLDAMIENYTSEGGVRSMEKTTPLFFIARAIWYPK